MWKEVVVVVVELVLVGAVEGLELKGLLAHFVAFVVEPLESEGWLTS